MDKEDKIKIGNKGICKKCGEFKTISTGKGWCDLCYRREKIGRIPLKKCMCSPDCKTMIPAFTTRGKPNNYALGHHIRGEKNSRWNGGMTVDNDDYELVRAPNNHPYADNRGYIRKHRLIMEQKLGRYLTREEIVHHINGIKNDNRPENLEVMIKKTHDSLKDGKTAVDHSKTKCIICNITNDEYRKNDNSKIWYVYINGYICRVCYERRQRALKRN